VGADFVVAEALERFSFLSARERQNNDLEGRDIELPTTSPLKLP